LSHNLDMKTLKGKQTDLDHGVYKDHLNAKRDEEKVRKDLEKDRADQALATKALKLDRKKLQAQDGDIDRATSRKREIERLRDIEKGLERHKVWEIEESRTREYEVLQQLTSARQKEKQLAKDKEALLISEKIYFEEKQRKIDAHIKSQKAKGNLLVDDFERRKDLNYQKQLDLHGKSLRDKYAMQDQRKEIQRLQSPGPPTDQQLAKVRNISEKKDTVFVDRVMQMRAEEKQKNLIRAQEMQRIAHEKWKFEKEGDQIRKREKNIETERLHAKSKMGDKVREAGEVGRRRQWELELGGGKGRGVSVGGMSSPRFVNEERMVRGKRDKDRDWEFGDVGRGDRRDNDDDEDTKEYVEKSRKKRK
jgi:hypothetical protein